MLTFMFLSSSFSFHFIFTYFQGESTNHHDYTEKPLERRELMRPVSQPLNSGRFDGESEYAKDFKAPGADAYARPPSPERVRTGPSLPFDGTTAYRADFVPKGVPDRYERKPAAPYSPSGKFEGESTNHADFPAPGRDAYQRPPTASAPQPAKNLPFDGTTAYRSDFVPKGVPDRYERKPAAPYSPSGKFEGESTNHADFAAPGLDAYQRPPVVGAPQAARNLPFEGDTTNRRDFTPKELPPRSHRYDATKLTREIETFFMMILTYWRFD